MAAECNPLRVQNAARYSALQRVRQAAHGAMLSPQTCEIPHKTRVARPRAPASGAMLGPAGTEAAIGVQIALLLCGDRLNLTSLRVS